MPEKQEGERDSGVRVLTPDGEDARTIAKAMASSTAGGILRCFQGRELTASEIASALDLPIPTIMYHLDALLDAGLIEISRIRYSVKGREVKIYRQSDEILIVASGQADLRAVLLKYASLFGITLFGAGVAVFLSPMGSPVIPQAGGALREMTEKSGMISGAPPPAEVVSDAISAGYALLPASPAPPVQEVVGIPEIAIGILIGGCLVICLLLCLDLIARKRDR